MAAIGDSAMVPQDVKPSHAAHPVNWLIGFVMAAVLIAGITGVVLALSSGLPTVAIVVALMTGAVFAGSLC
ncbi:hypothetical protein [Mycobacterium kyogaense]|uniref:hypothetical protein n=1 Tax=Mycobacterium kyogaense TaxID=2212479 RepID=UPI000DACCBC2|nr:hypothetical protein [Mycobacterium kyogaense]